MKRCLFGPAPATFTAGDLAPSEALLFDFDGKQPLTLPADADWNSIAARFPTGWEPDFLLVSLSYTSIPYRLFDCPVPIIGLAPDWNLLCSCYRHVLPRVDVALTDSAGVEQFARAEIGHVRPASLFGLEGSMLAGPGSMPAVERDIDVLFVGNCQPAVQRERLNWLGQLAALSKRRNVVIRLGVWGPEYWELLKRAKIVFNRSIRGECNRRVFEAAAAGSLLLQESENREVASILQAGSEYAVYDAGNLEEVIEHYLTHEDERQAITETVGRRVNEFTFSALWQRALSGLEPEWEELRERARQRAGRKGPAPVLMAGAWSAASGGGIGELEAALADPHPEREEYSRNPPNPHAECEEYSQNPHAEREEYSQNPHAEREEYSQNPQNPHAEREEYSQNPHAEREEYSRKVLISLREMNPHAEREEYSQNPHAEREEYSRKVLISLREMNPHAEREEYSQNLHAEREEYSRKVLISLREMNPHAEREEYSQNLHAEREEYSRKVLISLREMNPHAEREEYSQNLHAEREEYSRKVLISLREMNPHAEREEYSEASAQGHQTLALLESGSDLPDMIFDAPHYPPGFDLLGVEWERAGWLHAGNPHAEREAKRALLRLWLHLLLANLTGNLSHYQAAERGGLELPPVQAALGCALARNRRKAEALPLLRSAVTANPFDRAAARALHQALSDANDWAGRSAFVQEQLALHRAAPGLAPLEDWFKTPPPSGSELTSIILLACNEIAFTRLCLESVLRHTLACASGSQNAQGAYELILVDNGSTDATPEYFRELLAVHTRSAAMSGDRSQDETIRQIAGLGACLSATMPTRNNRNAPRSFSATLT